MARESGTTKIQMVPDILRDDSNFVKKYEPRIVSLGPIHRRNSKCQSGEGYKQELINSFVQASGQGLDFLIQKIENIQQLRNCFEEKVTKGLADDALALLLCRDGCAILQYIYRRPTQSMYNRIAQDILLLENQIPYKVLKELMRFSDKKEELEDSIVKFIKKHLNLPPQANPQLDVEIDGDHVHLLDLLRTSLLGKSQEETPKKRRDLQPLRNVRELKAAGIHLRQSSDWSLRKIDFSRRFHLLGHLYLPPITVNESTRVKLLNLVAYEMCLDFKNNPGPGVISYLFFLHSLINEAQDVKELTNAGVLNNSESDTELQTLISELRDAGLLPDDPEAYVGVKEKIQEYYGTLMSKMLQFYHAKIKDSSWPLAIFLAALLDLFFGGTQTWFAVKNWFSVSPASQSHS